MGKLNKDPNVSTPNPVNLNNLDARYSKPADVTAAIAAQATTDAGQYVTLPKIGRNPLTGMLHASGYGMKADGVTDNSAAFNNIISAATSLNAMVYLDQPGIYLVASAPTMQSYVKITGTVGAYTIIKYTGSGRLFDLSNMTHVTLSNLWIQITNTTTNTTAVYLSNSFRCAFEDVRFYGTVNNSSSTNATQNGVELRNNCGDNQFIRAYFDNLYRGVAVSSEMNYFVGCVFGLNVIQVHGDSGAYVAAGSFSNCTFVGNPAVTQFGIKIEVNSNEWWFNSCWIEGAQVAIQVGAYSTGGPYNFYWQGGKIAGSYKCVDIQNARQTRLDTLSIQYDNTNYVPSATITSGGTSALSGGTSETWTVTQPGTQPFAFPATPFLLRDSTQSGISAEYMEVTAISGNTWTVTRGKINTPTTHAASFTVYLAPYELLVSSNAPDGVASNILSSQAYQIATSWPTQWTVIDRTTLRLPVNATGNVSWQGNISLMPQGNADVGLSINAPSTTTASLMTLAVNGSTRFNFSKYGDLSVGSTLSVGAHLNMSSTSTPTLVAGAGLGATPPSIITTTNSNDSRGDCTFGTGSSPSTGVAITFTFAGAYATSPRVMLTGTNAATDPLGLYISARSTTSFTVSMANAPSASQPNTTYGFQWFVLS